MRQKIMLIFSIKQNKMLFKHDFKEFYFYYLNKNQL